MLLHQAEPAHAGAAFLRKGEGGAGLDAWLELGDSKQLTLGMVACRVRRDRLELQLALSVGGEDNVSSDLKKLKSVADGETQQLDVCMNGICEEHEFRAAESPWGDILVKNVSIARTRKELRDIRVVIPKEAQKYEFRGDIDGILKRICRR